MIPENERPWERMIRELYGGFSLLDEEIRLLRAIDQTILDIGGNGTSRSLEDLFLDSVDQFSQIHRTDTPLLCYVYVGPQLALLHREGSKPPHPTHIGMPAGLEPVLKPDSRVGPLLVVPERGDDLSSFFPDARTLLLCPIYSPLKVLLCVFLLADRRQRQGSQLAGQDFTRSLDALVSQLAIAYIHRERALQHQRIQELWGTFLERKLSPREGFEQLARRVPSFLSTFGPLKFPGRSPEVQILMLVRASDTGQPRHLVIRGTTGKEHDGTRIAIDDSICGLLVEEPQLPYFYDDPSKSKYGSRYKSYLGDEQPIRTELAVPLVGDDQLVGVLNLESEIEDAFNVHHRHAILALAAVIAPIVTVFEHRLAMNTAMQASVTSSTAHYLEALASVFRHAIGTPLTALRSNIDFATALVESDVKEAVRGVEAATVTGRKDKLTSSINEVDNKLKLAESAFARLLAIHSQISVFARDFAKDIAGYAQTGSMNLRDVVDATVMLATNSLLAKLGKNIRIECLTDETPATTRVFCSMLLKQHLYSILHNAILSIETRLETDPNPGVIAIAIQRDSPPDSQEVRLNQSWAVRIRDNGTGVNNDVLERLRSFQPGQHFRKSPGQGYGLSAAQRYVASIGGRIELESQFGKFFEVTLHLDEYRPNLHAALAIDGT